MNPERIPYQAVDFRVLADYAGTYRNEASTVWEVIAEGNRIFLKPPAEPRIKIFPESETDKKYSGG